MNFDAPALRSLSHNRVLFGMVTEIVHKRGIGWWRGKSVPIAGWRQLLGKIGTVAIEDRVSIPLDFNVARALPVFEDDCKLTRRSAL